MQLIPIKKNSLTETQNVRPKKLFLISKGRTRVPHGLNIREETY